MEQQLRSSRVVPDAHVSSTAAALPYAFTVHDNQVMVKFERVLLIDPPQYLKFIGPFTDQIQTVMTLKNITDKKVGFKIKTTAPQCYIVVPNCCELGPTEKAEITIILKQYDYDAKKRNKHKFLVQAVFTEPGDYAGGGKIFQWRDIEKGRIMNFKLNCLFEMPPVDQLFNDKSFYDKNILLLETNIETEQQNAPTDVKELCEEENLSRQEIINLKEESLQLEQKHENQQYQNSSAGGSQHLNEQNRNSIITLMTTLAIVTLLGTIIGNYIFVIE